MPFSLDLSVNGYILATTYPPITLYLCSTPPYAPHFTQLEQGLAHQQRKLTENLVNIVATRDDQLLQALLQLHRNSKSDAVILIEELNRTLERWNESTMANVEVSLRQQESDIMNQVVIITILVPLVSYIIMFTFS